MRRFVLMVVSIVSFGWLQAQEDTISAERPSESQSPNLMTQGYLQAEAGLRREASGADRTFFHPISTIRYGVSKKLEVRLEVDASDTKAASATTESNGLLPIQFGFKTPVLEEQGWVPKTSLLVMAGIPTLASKSQQVAHVFPLVRLLMENKLTENLELDYNAGAEWNGESTHPRWIFSIEPQMMIGRKWQVFAEAYGRWQKGSGAEQVVDAGFGYYITRNIKLDFNAGKGLSKEAPDYFVATGISFRFRPNN